MRALGAGGRAPGDLGAGDRAVTAPAAADRLQRRVLPRAVVLAARVDRPRRLGAALRRALHRSGRVELFFAFDDPAGAVAVIDLVRRLRGRDVRLVLLPVVRRGIPDDPAVERKRSYALADAAGGAAAPASCSRGASRSPRATPPSSPAGSPPALRVRRCSASASRRSGACGSTSRAPTRTSRRCGAASGGEPAPAAQGARAVRRNERRMRRRGPYDTAAAWVHGRWFFAQDRLQQIGHRLDELAGRRR